MKNMLILKFLFYFIERIDYDALARLIIKGLRRLAASTDTRLDDELLERILAAIGRRVSDKGGAK